MALENTDLLVVQKGTGGEEIRKCTLQQLDEFIQGGESVTYKGSKNFTNAADEPGAKSQGDLYINTTDGNWQWASGNNNQSITAVSVGDRCIWNETNVGWDVITTNNAEDGVTKVTGTLPIVVENGETAAPNVKVQEATTGSDGTVTLATAGDVTAGTVGKVVTADQLKSTNDQLGVIAGGGITTILGVDPIEIVTDGSEDGNASTTNTPAVTVKAAGISQLGVSAKYDETTLLEDAKDKTDYAEWLGTLNDEGHMTMKATATLFVPADFSALADA